MSAVGSGSELDAEVAVVGFGPVGSALAILLAQLGHRVVVLERWPEPYPLPRAVHFDHEVARILQSCGIGEALGEISEPGDVYEWRNRSGQTLLRFGRVGAGASGWPESSMFNQPALEALLDRRVGELGEIEIRRGVDVVGLDQADDHVTLHGTDVDGRPVDVRSRYAVGCDGANSTVRRLLGVPVEDLGFFYDWLIVDVVLHEPRVYDPINLQICDPARPTTVVSGGPGRRRWEFMRLPHEQLEDLNDVRVAWELLEPWDVSPANATLERHAVYTFNARYADRWRDRRVLLAGDAAHQMPPFAGQGMCSGLRDAVNLAWKLGLVLDGRAAETVLDSYPEERMPHARAVIDFSMELGKVICVPDEAEAAARDEAMSAAVTGELTEIPPLPPIEGGLFRSADVHAGHLFLQGRVARADRPGSPGLFDDVAGSGWRLVTVDPQPLDLDPALAAWFSVIGGEILTLGPGGLLADVDGTYARWFESHGSSWALQRPDFQIYGTASSAGEAAALVAGLREQLAPELVAS
jgi:2-polyprenyl-6-methoxyphenol hydroxylase-like FAD-dependent oxidoreductase